jgi:polyhydroxybutyrate depolymerase
MIVASAVALALGACDGDDGSQSKSSTSTAGSVQSTTTEAVPTTVTTVAASEGCTAGTEVQPGTDEKVTTTSGGAERWYYRRVPPVYDGTSPVPVVVDFHGYSEGSTVHLQMSDLGSLGDAEGFVTVTPEGTGPVPRWDTAFDSADMLYVGDLLDELDATLCVDRQRIYATGLSNGAFMTSAVACVYSDRFAAFAPVAGVQTPDDCEPTRPTPLITFHGTADTFVAYEGGLGVDALDLPAPDGSGSTIQDAAPPELLEGTPVPDVVHAWAVRNSCDVEPTETDVADDVVLTTYACDDADVQFYRIDGGGHSWPGSEFSQRIESVLGFTTMSISANELIWDFFVAHPLEVAA